VVFAERCARGARRARLAMRATEKRWSGAPYCMGPCYWRPALIGERGKDPGQPVKIRPERALLADDLVEREDHVTA
jgi:hypothetical protein